MNDELKNNDKLTEFLLYKSPTGDIKVDVLLRNETIWLPQKKIAQLFDVNIPAISKHLNNVFISGELNKEATVSILEIVQNESGRNVKRKVEFFKLDAFLQFNQEDILRNAGKVTAAIAKSFAETEFEKYRPIQDKQYISDFDRELKRLKE